jgi:hypothetical protein
MTLYEKLGVSAVKTGYVRHAATSSTRTAASSGSPASTWSATI